MKKILLLLICALYGTAATAQTFYVDAKDKYTRTTFEDNIKYSGYSIVDDEKDANYTLHFFIEGEYKISFKRTHRGYATVVDNKTNKEVFRSKVYKTTPATLNGYNASNAIANKIIRKQLGNFLERKNGK